MEPAIAASLEGRWVAVTDYSEQVIAPMGEHNSCEEAAPFCAKFPQ